MFLSTLPWREFIGAFLLPLPMSFLLLLAGVICLWRNRIRLGRWLATAGLVLLFLGGNGFLSSLLMGNLEQSVSSIDESSLAAKPVKTIVVLGGGITDVDGYPLISNLSSESLARTIEGIRLYRKSPGSRLLLSGAGPMQHSEADFMAQLARELGVPDQDIITETKTMNTGDQAVAIKQLLPDSDFILVTSASHMPRALAAFQRMGLHPLPAPIAHRIIEDGKHTFLGTMKALFFPPNSFSAATLERYLYELGGAWKTKNQLQGFKG